MRRAAVRRVKRRARCLKKSYDYLTRGRVNNGPVFFALSCELNRFAEFSRVPLDFIFSDMVLSLYRTEIPLNAEEVSRFYPHVVVNTLVC